MSSKIELFLNGQPINVVEQKEFWEVHFSNGSKDKLYHHVNEQKEAIWMWESGRIDETSLSIGSLLEHPDSHRGL